MVKTKDDLNTDRVKEKVKEAKEAMEGKNSKQKKSTKKVISKMSM